MGNCAAPISMEHFIMLIVGDIHGQINPYLMLLKRFPGEPSVQIGDFGFGFVDVPELPDNAWFFRGNHDNPDIVKKSKHNLGDFGVREIGGVKFFFLAGAWSIDHRMRLEGRDWWRDEELSIVQLNEALDLYTKEKPDIVLSHDGPDVATDLILNRYTLHKTKPIATRTGQALSAMYDTHQPELWVFGHWHVRWSKQVGRTVFRCLHELDWCQINKDNE